MRLREKWTPGQSATLLGQPGLGVVRVVAARRTWCTVELGNGQRKDTMLCALREVTP